MDGKATAAAIRMELQVVVNRLVQQHRPRPGLVAVLVGDNPASQVYVGAKLKACAEVGIVGQLMELPAQTTEAELLDLVRRLNEDPDIDGILVQLPLPTHISEDQVIATIHPSKDVDGFHPINMGRIAKGLTALPPATPAGVMELLRRYDVPLAGRHAVVIGRSNIVGTPLSLMLSRPGTDATVTLCHSRTQNLAQITRQADVLLVAAGRLNLVGPDMVRPGTVVVDVGTHRVVDPTAKAGYRVRGDVDYPAVAPLASLITPVPGGVGPMTVAQLLRNTVQAYHWRRGLQPQEHA